MHEVGIIQSTLTLAEQYARNAGAEGIIEIRLQVGQMTGVVPEALQYAFTILREGTLAEAAQLVVEYVSAVCWCATCRREFEAGGLFGVCPDCGTPSGEVRRGRELDLISMEVY